MKIIRQWVMGASALALAALAAPVAAQTACAPGSPQLIVYHAGSLTAAFSQVEKLFTQQTGICVLDVSAGSVDLARRVTAGGEACDIYASADFEDIDVLLKPAGFARYNIIFAQGGMVLAYTTGSRNAATIAAPGDFNPPASVPDAADDWYLQLTRPGVTVGSSHPFLDPSGYRAHMIFELTEDHYRAPNLYDTLLTHYVLTRPTDALGKTYDYQIIYEHSALAAYIADATKSYRFVRLPDDVGLADPEKNRVYGKAGVIMPGLRVPRTASSVRIPATRVQWGLTILNNAPNHENAVKFLQLLFGAQGVAMQAATGPAPVSPPLVSHEDFRDLPPSLRSVVKVERRDQ
ncbi:MAG TPA: substrate-binding domain-containing protein [Burkholderiales bacterium]|nr:substrate-binding domain-containing protein [Burkholderiales bacterium]